MKQHIAQSGKKTGQFVPCPAKKCRIGGTHTDTNTLYSVKAWLSSKGIKKNLKDLRESDLIQFKRLPKVEQEDWKFGQVVLQRERQERKDKKVLGNKPVTKPSGEDKETILDSIVRLKAMNKAEADKQRNIYQPLYGRARITEDGFIVQERTYRSSELQDMNKIFDAYGQLFSERTMDIDEVKNLIYNSPNLTDDDKHLFARPIGDVKRHGGWWSRNDLEDYARILAGLRKDAESGHELGTNSSYFLYTKGYEVPPLGPGRNGPLQVKDMSRDKETQEGLTKKLNAFLDGIQQKK